MNRVMVIGCCGSGKSTFSKKLNALTNIEVFHLDMYYWTKNWKETAPNQWREIVEMISDNEKWIIDGNYSGTMDTRLKKADTIIYLDYPTIHCLWRITKRICKYWGKERPDMPIGCKERFDLDFYHYVATFNILKRKGIIRKINAFADEKNIHIFKNDRETKKYLEQLT